MIWAHGLLQAKGSHTGKGKPELPTKKNTPCDCFLVTQRGLNSTDPRGKFEPLVQLEGGTNWTDEGVSWKGKVRFALKKGGKNEVSEGAHLAGLGMSERSLHRDREESVGNQDSPLEESRGHPQKKRGLATGRRGGALKVSLKS